MTTRSLASHLIPVLAAIRLHALDLEHSRSNVIREISASRRESARNLLHYLSLRQHDLREIQGQLALLGLSRLARSEAHTLGTLDAVIEALHALAGQPVPDGHVRQGVDIRAGEALLREHADTLLGTPAGPYRSHIMVTLPSEAATQPRL
ncbi:MAG: hypothetical protein PHX10_04920, partial [Gallionellaceae bacterium]|nr:hypothetical protein [Gallionellaceae bacterium]